jgi:hypothetical protein
VNRFKHSRIEGLTWVAGDHSLVAGLAIMLALMLNGAAAAATPSASSVVDVESGRTNANLAILSVLQPVPPGAQPGGGMFLQATVNARTWIGRNTKVVFYFAQHNVPSAGDVAIASASLGVHRDLIRPWRQPRMCHLRCHRDFILCWPAPALTIAPPPRERST